jgi:hypothetical protein
MIPIENANGLFRDEQTNAVINTNDREYNQYIKLKNKKLIEQSELDSIKSDINDIKNALKIIMESINN